MKHLSLLYIAVVQLAFSALDIYARSCLRGSDSFLSGLISEWLIIWILLQVAIAPFQIRLIVKNGLGKGIALMNGFSVLYALIGGYVFLDEAIHWNHVIAVCLVLTAIYLFATAKHHHHHHVFTTPPIALPQPEKETV